MMASKIIIYALLLFYFPLFTLSIRNIPHKDSFTELDTNFEKTKWHGFLRFLDAEKGNQITGMSELKKYFHRFGYMAKDSQHDHDEILNFNDVFDDEFESILEKYQINLGLEKTRKLDKGTMQSIMSPRCGFSDNSHTLPHHSHVVQHYSFFVGQPRWIRDTPITLTYAFSPEDTIDYIRSSDIKLAIQRAFTRWSEVIPVQFTETELYSMADIKIGFYSGDHGDICPFDGRLGVLAHATPPEDGSLHFDADEKWSVDFHKQKSKDAVDLESVATHEIGHILGLGHSSFKESVMYPNLDRAKKVNLRLDDVEGVQALYGLNPNFDRTFFLKSKPQTSWSNKSSSKWMMTTFSILVVLVVSFIS